MLLAPAKRLGRAVSLRKSHSALDAVGGAVPIPTTQFAFRASQYVTNPQRNPLKSFFDKFEHISDCPPVLGIFNDIPWHKLREDEVHSWARAGFSWVVNDGEHQTYEGRYGSEQNAIIARLGMLPIQRLHREAISEHGDSFQKGARATMRPYGTTLEHAQTYFQSISFPIPGSATQDDRGGYPVRGGDRVMKFTPEGLRNAEIDTQGWIQFETGEYIFKHKLRDKILDLVAAQGKHKACVFIGPFDAIIRDGADPQMAAAINDLIYEGTRRGIPMGRVIGSGTMEDPQEIENAMVESMQCGTKLICVHKMTSDLPYYGAMNVAEPFWKACKRAGY